MTIVSNAQEHVPAKLWRLRAQAIETVAVHDEALRVEAQSGVEAPVVEKKQTSRRVAIGIVLLIALANRLS